MNTKLELLILERDALRKKLDDEGKTYGCDELGIFPSDAKFYEYRSNNITDLKKLGSLMREIEKLEWEQMSDEEQKKQLEVWEKISAKISANKIKTHVPSQSNKSCFVAIIAVTISLFLLFVIVYWLLGNF